MTAAAERRAARPCCARCRWVFVGDLEHRLRRRALRHAACAAAGLPGAGATRCRWLAFAVWVLLVARGLAARPARSGLHLAVTGVLMHAGYLGGVWSAVKLGMGAGTAALIVGLQPVLTALWVSLDAAASTASTPRQWLGLALGLAGLMLVVWHKLGVGEVTASNLALALLALASITAGTLYQKRWVAPCDVRTANMVQLLAALAGHAAAGAALESRADAAGIRNWSARWPGRCSC